MTNQIDELMGLFDEAAEASFDQGLHRRTLDDAPEEKREAFKTALEAALKPGGPAFYIIGPELEKLKKDGTRAVTLYTEPVTNGLDVPVYTVAPPSQTPDALKPAEPFGYANTNTGQFFKDVEDCRKNNEGHWRTVYTAAPPAQTPPRLTDDELESIRIQCANEFAEGCRTGSIGQVKTLSRAIETAVRKQFGVNDE